MKVAVIGYGHVGMAVFSSFLMMPEVHELTLVGRNVTRIEGELADYRDCQAINTNIRKKLTGGGYENTVGADIIIYTCGPSIKSAEQTRLDLLKENLDIAREVSAELNKYNRDGIIIVISNPVDIIVQALMEYTNRPRSKVIGTGTLLDTARLRRQAADILGIQPENIVTCVLGEHGGSSCIMWSWSRILGFTLDEFLDAELPEPLRIGREKLLELNRSAGLRIFEQKGSTAYGVAAAAAQISDAIIYDSNEILPVSAYAEGEYGINGIALSLPCLVNANGATIIPSGRITNDELKALQSSANVIKEAGSGLLQSTRWLRH